MAKTKSNKKRDGAVSMEISTDGNLHLPQAMDTSEPTVSKPVLGVVNRKIRKAAPMRRSKNLKKMKAVEKAISKSEQSKEKISKNKIKMQRIQSAKSLYE